MLRIVIFFSLLFLGVVLPVKSFAEKSKAVTNSKSIKAKKKQVVSKKNIEEKKPEAKDKKTTDKQKSEFKNLLSGGDSKEKIPVFIKSDSLSLDTKDRKFIYQGNVEVVRGDLQITGDKVTGTYDESNQLQMVVFEKNVVVTRAEDMRASSERAVYRVAAATIEMTEGPELSRNGNVLSADKVIIYVNEDRSEAEGNVRVKVVSTGEDKNIVKKSASKKDEDNEEESVVE